MTVTYSAKVATANFSCFFKLLIRWRGSIYKILWREFFIFSVAYFFLSFLYRLALTETQKEYFEKGAEYCSRFSNLIPVAFVLGFYVNHIASRWWEKFRTLPWPGRMAMYVTAHLYGHDERARLMRRTIMRYICLSYVITMSSISPPVKKRFPSWKYMSDAGLMLANEENIMENLKTPYNKFFVPLVWASALVTRARKEGMIKDDFAVKTLIDEINDFRTKSFQLFNFDWINIPLVYTQVVTLAVYTFFLSCLMGRQYLDNGYVGDMYFPLFTFLQFFFYMGWLKVAETMLNPFGEDDDDFDINHLIDRHLKVSYLVVDEMHAEHPELIRDQYWDTIEFDLPYTEETKQFKQDPLLGSALDVEVPQEKATFVPSSLISVPEEDIADVAETASQAALSSQGHGDSIGIFLRRPTVTSFRDFVAAASGRSGRGLSRKASKASISSQTSERAGGIFKSLRKSFSRKARWQRSPEESDSESQGIKMKPGQHLAPSRAGSFQSNDQQYLDPTSCQEHSREEMVFHMSDSSSDDSRGSFGDQTDSHSDAKQKPKHLKSRRKSIEENQLPVGRSHHALERRHDHATLDLHHGAKKGHIRDPGKPKDEEVLFPINEDPDSSVTDGSGKGDSFLREVREKLQKLQEMEEPPPHQQSSPSAEMEILNLLGTSAKSSAIHCTGTREQESSNFS